MCSSGLLVAGRNALVALRNSLVSLLEAEGSDEDHAE
jgi:hypothetical protein